MRHPYQTPDLIVLNVDITDILTNSQGSEQDPYVDDKFTLIYSNP